MPGHEAEVEIRQVFSPDDFGEALTPEGHDACRRGLDPPRFCGHCRRRMVVQVTPTGWTARCVEHGTTSG